MTVGERELPWALRVERDTTEREGYPPRSEWDDGPWQTEPDIVEWRHLGMPCLIVRSGSSGALCGYVGVSEGHPFHGKDYNELYDSDADLNVHGGLTYASACAGHICHVPQPGESEHVWWLGFDCAHSGDVSPAFRKYFRERGLDMLEGYEQYRDINYVRGEVESLAEQLKAMT